MLVSQCALGLTDGLSKGHTEAASPLDRMALSRRRRSVFKAAYIYTDLPEIPSRLLRRNAPIFSSYALLRNTST